MLAFTVTISFSLNWCQYKIKLRLCMSSQEQKVANYKHIHCSGQTLNCVNNQKQLVNGAISVHRNKPSWFFIDCRSVFCELSGCVFFCGE